MAESKLQLVSDGSNYLMPPQNLSTAT